LRETTSAGANEVPTPYSPWQREQLSSNCFQPWYASWEIVSRGAEWYSSFTCCACPTRAAPTVSSNAKKAAPAARASGEVQGMLIW